jgi:hypothetical protein
VPINSTLAYLKSLLDGLAMPGGAPNLRAFITPPSPDDNPEGTPTAYIWPASGEESRNTERGGTVPRALTKPVPGANPNSGTKPIDHMVHVYVIWDQANDDELADSLFPGMLDAIGWQLRVSTDPVVVVDSFDGTISQLIDVGETIPYQITVRYLEDQRYLRYDALLPLPVMELIQSLFRVTSVEADELRIGSIIEQRTKLSHADVLDLFLEMRTKDAAYAVSAGIVDEIKDVQIPPGSPVVALVFQR